MIVRTIPLAMFCALTLSGQALADPDFPPPPAAPLPGEPAVPPIINVMCDNAAQPPAPGMRPLAVLAKFGFDGTIATAYACMAGSPVRRYNVTVKAVLTNPAGIVLGGGSVGPFCTQPKGLQGQWAVCSAPRFALGIKNVPVCPKGPTSCPLPGIRPTAARVTLAWQDSPAGPTRRAEFTVPVRAI